MAFAGSKIDHFTGQIVAYRSVDMYFQDASEVENEEVFLFKISDPEVSVIKLIYEHYGYSKIGAGILAKHPMIRVTVHRDKKCDETYDSYVKSAPPIQTQSGKEIVKPVEFLGNLNEEELAAGQPLKCYRIENGEINVIETQ
jgi:hypothetical protein